jgi:hypothetical protein
MSETLEELKHPSILANQAELLPRPETDISVDFLVSEIGLSQESLDRSYVKSVLGLVSDAWKEVGEPDDPADKLRAEAQREWLVDIALRASGKDSDYVAGHHLAEYLGDTEAEAVAEEVLSKYTNSEEAAQLLSELPDIIDEFKLAEKFPGFELDKDLKVAVIPDSEMEQYRKQLPGSGALIEATDGGRGIFVTESSYRLIMDKESTGSRGFMAHEISHSIKGYKLGDGEQPLGVLFDELHAEWSGDDKGGYFDEKHMANFLAASGFELRREILPKMASGEMTMDDVIAEANDTFGPLNTLKLLGYLPGLYGGGDSQAELVDSCLEYAVQNGTTTQEQIESVIEERFDPARAEVMLRNSSVAPLIPKSLKKVMISQAEKKREGQ